MHLLRVTQCHSQEMLTIFYREATSSLVRAQLTGELLLPDDGLIRCEATRHHDGLRSDENLVLDTNTSLPCASEMMPESLTAQLPEGEVSDCKLFPDLGAARQVRRNQVTIDLYR
jgi:hypothetical protein